MEFSLRGPNLMNPRKGQITEENHEIHLEIPYIQTHTCLSANFYWVELGLRRFPASLMVTQKLTDKSEFTNFDFL